MDAAIDETRRRWPLASAAFDALMDRAPFDSIEDGLVQESLVYSHLQAGPEFKAWRAATPVAHRSTTTPPPEPVVTFGRAAGILDVRLNRPEVRNALNVAMRDEWLDALAVAHADPSLEVVISGNGPSFCAGGDLDEFGTFPSPGEAHHIRLQTSIGAAIARIAARVTFYLHGACYGSGIELPAFAARVVAAPDTRIALPEIGIGLIPGAGGTVSITNRIGVERMRRLTLSREVIDAETALAWGLIDEIAIR
ncbi:MAG: enoyl-CoA hydratase/isomerase family protein [Actinobacteria bacterium]|nr:enoyl-CoA hydratase/isomerase family protein [Actinomycetota bacterium]